MSREGVDYWRSLVERRGEGATGPAWRTDEIPPLGGLSRRAFLRLAGASAALAGVGTACFESPGETILPYVDRPPETTPGVATAYATSLEHEGFGVGVVVESREGRPVKVEGNPRHPASRGAAGLFEQASLLALYDPFRARGIQHAGRTVLWRDFVERFAPAAGGARGPGSVRFLMEPTASPLLNQLVGRLRAERSDVQFHFHAPLHAKAPREGVRIATGRWLQPLPDFARASVAWILDGDPLGTGPHQLAHARAFATRRRVRSASDPMSRLYVAEPAPSVTGNAADHRIRRSAAAIPAMLAAVLVEVARARGAWPDLVAALVPLAAHESDGGLVRAIAGDLASRPGEALVVVGEHQPAVVHAMGHALQSLLERPSGGRLGEQSGPLALVESGLLEAMAPAEELAPLVEAMRAGQVSTLVNLGGNPVYDAPAELDFAAALAEVGDRVGLAPLRDETAQRCDWHVAERHALESWGDTRALDGTAALIQPLIAPLWEGYTRADLLAAFLGDAAPDVHARLRGRWADVGDAGDARWRSLLAEGVVPDSASAARSADVDPARVADAVAKAIAESRLPAPPAPDRIEVVFRRDARVHDGRHADNPWLQELPDPITKLTWDDAAWIAPATARTLGVDTGDWLRLRRGDRSIEIPALVVPGQAERSLLLSLGYGRGAMVPVAEGVGVDVGPIRTSDAGRLATDVVVERVTERSPHAFAVTQTHFRLHGRDVVRERTRGDLLERPGPEADAGRASLYAPPTPGGPQWGMTIDQTVCTGCSACVVACQAENNIPVVGREAVSNGREMHWLRIDRYLRGSEEEPASVSQPMACQHCEMAPCEYVCPVEATVHSDDGLNEMVYNRCVGTRFCSNNCPYKVRRFNWFEFNGDVPETRRMQFNPDVTVRARGVMEKCTYCVQRIRRAEIRARGEGRPLRDGEVVTACQQACPTGAIVFGSIDDPDSAVARARDVPHAYGVLAELGTRPRTRYLARIRNPNPVLEADDDAETP
ncbi:MAG: 4Fe-4S dicluster domain-containing protein [Myxococcota bacterium]